MEFTIGDVVSLKSGGPNMTVQGVLGDGTLHNFVDIALRTKGFKDGDVVAEWFDSRNERKSDTFKKEVLKKVD